MNQGKGKCLLFIFIFLVKIIYCKNVPIKIPAFVEDPENSLWVELGEEIISNGIFPVKKTDEGEMVKIQIDGKTAWTIKPIKRASGEMVGGYWYFDVLPWAEWTEWFGDANKLELVFCYFDTGRNCSFSYDSSDPTVKVIPTSPGAWKTPPNMKNFIKNTRTWKIERFELPLPYFGKRCNGHDFRFQFSPQDAEFSIAWIVLRKVKEDYKLEIPRKINVNFQKLDKIKSYKSEIILPTNLYRQTNKNIIVIEAEEGSNLIFQEGGGIEFDKQAGGNAYITRLEYGEWKFIVENPGKYQAWERAYFPSGGNWNHSESMDDGPKQTITDNANEKEKLNKWVWIRGPIYNLEKGEHIWKFHDYHGGAKLDQLILTSDLNFIPEGKITEVSLIDGVNEGECYTSNIFPLDVKKWIKIDIEKEDRGGTVEIYYSIDGGKNYSMLEKERNLENIKTLGNGKDSIQFKFLLKRGEEGLSPIIKNLYVYYLPGPKDKIVFENEKFFLSFIPQGLIEFNDKEKNISFIKENVIPQFFSIKCQKGQEVKIVNVEETDFTGWKKEGNTLTLRYNSSLGLKIICKIEISDKKSIWNMEIENNSEYTIHSVTYPIFQGVKVGKNHKDDILISQNCWHQFIINPVEKKQRGNDRPFMFWIDLYDNDAGLYMGAHPSKEDYRNFGFIFPPYDTTSLTLGIYEYNIGNFPKKKWVSSDYIIALHEGDWHKGADIYREWAERNLDKPVIPEWAFWSDGWRCWDADTVPNYGFSNISRAAEFNIKNKIDFQGNNRQMLEGPIQYVGVAFPYPSPIWGPVDEFRQNLIDANILGNHTNFYINAVRYSPGRFLDEKGVLKRISYIVPVEWMDKNIPIPKFYMEGKVSPMGWGKEIQRQNVDKEWEDYLYSWVEKYVKDYKATGIYFDQLILYPPKEAVRLLDRLYKNLTLFEPHFVITGEGANVYTGKYVIHMTSGVLNHTEIYRYTLPEHILLDGRWNGGTREFFGGEKRWNCVFLTGCRYEGIDKGLAKSPFIEEIWEKRLWLRRKTKQILYPAKFQDTVGITILDSKGEIVPNPEIVKEGEISAYEGVQAKWFLNKNNGNSLCLINIVNSPVKDGYKIKISTEKFGPVKKAWMWTIDGVFESLEGQEEKGEYTFSVPRSENSTIVLVNKCEPIVELEIDKPYIAKGNKLPVKITFLNLNESPIDITGEWELPEGWKCKKIEIKNLPPGKYLDMERYIEISKKADLKRYDIYLKVNWQGGNIKKYVYFSVINPIFMRLQNLPEGLEVILDNVGDKKYDLSVSLSLPKPLTTEEQVKKIEINPGETKSILYSFRGIEKMDRPLIAKVNLIYSEETVEKIISIYPPVPNPDFELDSAGDERPDWWSCIGSQGTGDFVNPAINLKLDKEIKYTGNYSLRLNPLDKNIHKFKTQRAFPLIKGFLHSGKEYKITFALRKETENPDAFFVVNGKKFAPKKIGEWETFTIDVKGGSFLDLNLYNGGDTPIWLDNIKIEEKTILNGE